MKKLLLILASVCVISLTSCIPFESDDDNLLVGTEWVNVDMTEGLKFLTTNSAMYFVGSVSCTGNYSYDASAKTILFTNFIISTSSGVVEITDASFVGETWLKLSWHIIGQPEDCYEMLYKVR